MSWRVGRPLGALRSLTGEAGWRLVEIPGRGALPGVATRLPLRRCDGAACGVESCRTARAARLLSLVARLSRVARPGAWIAARHHRTRCPGSAAKRAGAVAILAEVSRGPGPALSGEVLPELALCPGTATLSGWQRGG